jgi:hypothetical protein
VVALPKPNDHRRKVFDPGGELPRGIVTGIECRNDNKPDWYAGFVV